MGHVVLLTPGFVGRPRVTRSFARRKRRQAVVCGMDVVYAIVTLVGERLEVRQTSEGGFEVAGYTCKPWGGVMSG